MFYNHLDSVIIENYRNNVGDNIDYERFPKGIRYSFIKEIKIRFLSLLPKNVLRKFLKISLLRRIIVTPIWNYMGDLEDLYNALDDDDSKQTLILVITYKILGFKKIKLPYNNEQYKQITKKLSNSISISKEEYINLKEYDYDINVILPAKAIYDTFIYKHYKYKNIEAKENEIILDLGAWKGDTALYFSHCVGENGHVYSFEFMPENIRDFKKHLKINSANNIHLVEHPVWNNSGENVFVLGSGSGAKIVNERIKDSLQYITISVDDFIRKMSLNRVDFIKMDIEGAESFALMGASETIRKFKPKLAISSYHSQHDFARIHKLIFEIEPTYKLYLNHCSIYQEETVIFAQV